MSKSMIRKSMIRKWYRKTIGNLIPEYGVLSLIGCFLVNCIVYWGAQTIMKNHHHYDFTTKLDNRIPFIKEWVIIYLVCYVFWAINYVLISHEGKEKWFRFVTADISSRLICGIFFIVLPTTNIRPEVLGNDIFSRLMSFVYYIDHPSNLFPSIHCLVSWYCFIGIRSSKKVPSWYKVFSCLFALMVCLSTQFTKQHYLIDIAGGILIAEICYYIACHTQIFLFTEKVFLWLNQRIFGVANYDE